MNKIQVEKPKVRRWQSYTLGQYVALRNGVPLGRAAGMDLAKRPFWVRAGVNLAYLVVCLLLALAFRKEIL